MRRIFALPTVLGLVLAVVGSAGCGGTGREPAPEGSPPTASPSASAQSPAPGNHQLTIDFEGNTYRYLLHAPPGYTVTKQLPLVVALHAYPGDGAALREMIGMDAIADRESFLVAYPTGIGGGFNALVCCGNTDDIGFLRALTAHLITVWRADPNRVYVTGISNGGDMSFRAAVEATGVFAAIGVVSAGFGGPRVRATDYVPKSPVSVITFIGGQDQYFDVFRTGLDTWRQRLNCTPASSGPLPGGVRGTFSRAHCADGSDIDVYAIDRMGHAWPGAKNGRLAGWDIALPATELIWAFFAAHPRPAG